MFAWLSHLSGLHVPPVGWAVVAVLAVLVLVGSVGTVVLWPRSRLWVIHSRLHRLATKNDGDIRRNARNDLDDALRMLRSARQACVCSGQVDDAAELALLMHGIEMARDQVSCDYVPSPVNFQHYRREVTIDRLSASGAIRDRCRDLALQIHDGLRLLPDQLSEARQAVEQVNDRRLV